METRDMVRMANQIASFFKGYGHEDGVKETAGHINNFWEPRMRRLLLAHLEKGGEGLDQLVRDAAPLIRRPKAEAA
jgi:formate dehydrogenase subunit delta